MPNDTQPRQQSEFSAAQCSADEVILGIAWWNGLTQKERITVLIQASDHKHDPSVADAWMLWRAGAISTESEECQ